MTINPKAGRVTWNPLSLRSAEPFPAKHTCSINKPYFRHLKLKKDNRISDHTKILGPAVDPRSNKSI